MPRRARVALAGVTWHVMQRGNNRSNCFFAVEDYELYLALLDQQARKHDVAIHAYVLMTNHVHILMTPESVEGVSLTMKNASQRYVQYINRKYGRSGTLWDGRFKSCLAQDERYVMECYRYIELNPVRAGMVAHAADYKWSSFRANALSEWNRLLTAHPQFLQLGGDPAARCESYRALFGSYMDPAVAGEIIAATEGNHVLGGAHFADEVETRLGRRATRRARGRSPRLPE